LYQSSSVIQRLVSSEWVVIGVIRINELKD
jgi:hypothetical protein